MVETSRWMEMVEENPDHSSWYIERFRTMAAEGKDLDGEARLIDAMAARGSRILDAGCGPGRLGGRLHQLGHDVVGVDVDPALIEAAEADHPGPTWLARDLALLDLPADGIGEPFDIIVSAGNVMTFLAASTRTMALTALRKHLAPSGRMVIGFGAGRDYEFDDFFDDAAEAGLTPSLKLASWDVLRFDNDSGFLVAVLTASGATSDADAQGEAAEDHEQAAGNQPGRVGGLGLRSR